MQGWLSSVLGKASRNMFTQAPGMCCRLDFHCAGNRQKASTHTLARGGCYCVITLA